MIAAAGLTLMGSSRLLGNLPIWVWLLLAAFTALATQPRLLDYLRRGIDAIATASRALAIVLAWVVFVLAFINVVTRYLNVHVEQDILIGQVDSATWQAFAIMFLLGVNYGVKAGVNPRVDFWWADFSERRKAWIDFVLHTVLLIPFLVMAIRLAFPYAKTALGQQRDGTWPSGYRVWETWEQSGNADTLPVGPVKALIVVCFSLWLIQILSETIKQGFILMGRRELAGLPDHQHSPLRIE